MGHCWIGPFQNDNVQLLQGGPWNHGRLRCHRQGEFRRSQKLDSGNREVRTRECHQNTR